MITIALTFRKSYKILSVISTKKKKKKKKKKKRVVELLHILQFYNNGVGKE